MYAIRSYYEVLRSDSAVFCPPEDAAAWAGAIQQLLESPNKAARLAANAREQAKAFSWTARASRAVEGLG